MAKIAIYLTMIILVSAQVDEPLSAEVNRGLRATTLSQHHGNLGEPQSDTKEGKGITIELALMDEKPMLGTVSEEFEKLEKELKELLEELKTMEQEAEEKIREELLPHLKREIEKLKKWLREFQFDDDSPAPQKT